MWYHDPGPCIVCDAPHSTCVPAGYTGPARTVTVVQLSSRDRQPVTARPRLDAAPVSSLREKRLARRGRR